MKNIVFDSNSHVYFIGIGGVSMSGLAHILMDKGVRVSGSDAQASPNTERLEKEGATIYLGQSADHIRKDLQVVVYTAAIHEDNPEYQQAKAYGIPMMNRKDLLAKVMADYEKSVAIAGTHGKTTTTAMLSYIFLEAKLDPTISIGANFKKIDGNVRVGHSETFVAEACEYTNSFLALHPYASIVLNVEEDHLDFFKGIQDIRHSFHQFVLNTSPKGVVVLNQSILHHEELTKDYQGRVLTFGLEKGDVHSQHLHSLSHGGNGFDLIYQGKTLGLIELPVGGKHNVENALAAIAIALNFGVDIEAIQKGLKGFHGADRRFEKKGFYHQAEVIDDYAHHPQEIEATLSMANQYPRKRLIVAFQSHTYSRTKALFEDFAKALAKVDVCWLAPIYAAREANDPSVSSTLLAQRINELNGNALDFESFDQMIEYAKKELKKGDLFLTVGAGNIFEVGERLVKSDQ